MTSVNVKDAKTQLDRLLARAEAEEMVTITRAGVMVAALVPEEATTPRAFGPMSFTVPQDFDAPLLELELAAWE